jgi:hypothetical protein
MRQREESAGILLDGTAVAGASGVDDSFGFFLDGMLEDGLYD